MSDILVGGQAVLEGVMMRAPGIMSIAVRRQNGSIEIHKDQTKSVSDRMPWLKKPFIRGILALGQSLTLGFKALNFSSAVALADLEMAENPDQESAGEVNAPESMSAWSVAGVIIATLVMGIGFFFLLPLYLTELMGRMFPLVIENTFLFNVVDGIIRVIFFLLYVLAISLMPDIRRVFQYHGAEHKAIFAYEAGLPLTLENARKFTTFHPRCGTAFLLTVMVIAVFVFSLVPSSLPIWIKALSRIVLLPVIASVSFEVIRKAAESSNPIFGIMIRPGLWMQRITTREPDDDQLEVGLTALRVALENTDNDPDALII